MRDHFRMIVKPENPVEKALVDVLHFPGPGAWPSWGTSSGFGPDSGGRSSSRNTWRIKAEGNALIVFHSASDELNPEHHQCSL